MTKVDLIAKLEEIRKRDFDDESMHVDADAALLAYINDPEITRAFNAVDKWYA